MRKRPDPTFIVVDLFCGAGGTSLGFKRANRKGYFISEVIACVNHDPLSIRNHAENFPNCVHFMEDVRNMDMDSLLRIVQKYRALYPNAKLILWASLECTHFSNAKTGSRDADSRTLAHALYQYIHILKPELVMIENVREFMSWGPLVPKVVKAKDGDGNHCPIVYNKKKNCYSGHWIPEDRRKGRDYVKWMQTIEGFGYRYNSRLLNSADYGSYQARLRYFGIFATPEMPISFPDQTHDKFGRWGLPKWKAVRDVLSLDEIGQSIFKRKKPLSPNTLERIMAGLLKFVAKDQHQYLIKNYGGDPENRAVSLDNPAPTVTTVPHEMMVTADFLVRSNGGDAKDRISDLDSPLGTITTSPNQQLVKADFMIQYNGKPESAPASLDDPSRTQTTKDRFGLIQSIFIDNQYGHDGQARGASSLDSPSNTLATVPKKALVQAAFIDRQFGNSTGSSLDDPSGTLTGEPKSNLIHAEFLMPTNYSNEPTSLDSPSPVLTANRKYHYVVSVKPWLMTNMHGNAGSDIDAPAPTLLTGTHHYLLNPQFGNSGGSIDQPSFTLIAKMDKRPPQLVTIEPDLSADQDQYISIDHGFFKDKSVDVRDRIQVFMALYGIRDIYMRMLNIGELKRIQGLNLKPEADEKEVDYILKGPKDQQKKQIGNAVEPRVVTAWIQDYYDNYKGHALAPQLKLFA